MKNFVALAVTLAGLMSSAYAQQSNYGQCGGIGWTGTRETGRFTSRSFTDSGLTTCNSGYEAFGTYQYLVALIMSTQMDLCRAKLL